MKIRALMVELLHVDRWKDKHGKSNGQLPFFFDINAL